MRELTATGPNTPRAAFVAHKASQGPPVQLAFLLLPWGVREHSNGLVRVGGNGAVAGVPMAEEFAARGGMWRSDTGTQHPALIAFSPMLGSQSFASF